MKSTITPSHSFRILAIILISIFFGSISGYALLGTNRDYFNYLSFYQQLSGVSDFSSSRFEIGFILASGVFKFVFDASLYFFWAVLATFSIFIKFIIFSHSARPLPTVLFYLFCWYPLHEYTQIRAAVAMAFVFLAVEFYFRRWFLHFAVLIGLGSLFHASAIVMAAAIPAAYFLAFLRLPSVVTCALVIAVALQFVIEPLVAIATQLSPLADTYAANIDGFSVNLLSGANLLTVALLATMGFAGSLNSQRDKTFFVLVLFGLAAAVAFQAMPVISHRLREMFLIFLVPIAFNMRLTPLGLVQFGTASALAGWYLYSHVSQGVIWT